MIGWARRVGLSVGLKTVSRTHVIIDEAVLKRIDAVAGPRGRSRFLEEAALEKLRRAELRAALDATAGILDPSDYPEFRDVSTSAKTVKKRRAEDSE